MNHTHYKCISLSKQKNFSLNYPRVLLHAHVLQGPYGIRKLWLVSQKNVPWHTVKQVENIKCTALIHAIGMWLRAFTKWQRCYEEFI